MIKPIGIAFCSLITLAAATVRAQPAPQSNPSTVDSYGSAKSLASPALLEELAERLWDLEDQTVEAPKTAVAANVLVGAAHGSDVPWHLLLGPAISVRLFPVGRFTTRRAVLERRLELLTTHHAVRLQLVLAQECARAQADIEELEARLGETQRRLLALNAPIAPRPAMIVATSGAKRRHPAFTPQCFPSSREGRTTSTSPGRQVVPESLPTEEDRVRRREFLTGVEVDLIGRLTAAQSNLQFLIATDSRASDAVEKAKSVVAETGSPTSRLFFEVFAGYTFQLSQSGLGQDLGGLTSGGGVGFRSLVDFSAGMFLAENRTWGFSLSISTRLND